MNKEFKWRNSFKSIVFAIFFASALISCGSGGNEEGNLSYTVTYSGNGNNSGSVPNDTTKYKQGQTVTVLGNIGNLVKSGYSYTGWNTQTDGNGTTYTQGQSFTMSAGNVTLYARWSTNPTYNVIYNANGADSGNVPVDTTNYEQGQAVMVLSNTGNLEKAGYASQGGTRPLTGVVLLTFRGNPLP